MKAIECRNLTRRFGRGKAAGVLALDAVDLAVEEGDVYGFLGPNGAGKTTAIRLLTGMAQPTAGSVRLLGRDLGADPASARRLYGYLPEQPSFYSWMTAGETLRHAARLHGLSRAKADARAGELLELVDLTRTGRRRVGGFSRGMKQRLGLAAALVHDPVLLLLDEPASALDPAGRREVLDLVARLRGKVTIFMSTHILTDVERVCATVGIIAEGRLVVEAGRDELLARYARPVFEIEYAGDDAAPPDEKARAFAAGLKELAWVAAVAVKPRLIRVEAADANRAEKELFGKAVASGLRVIRYEKVRPSLEDVFLKLTAAEGSG